MLAYSNTLGGFYDDIRKNVIVEKIIEQTKMNYGDGQIRAFTNSLPAVSNALQNVDIPEDVEVGIEFRVPLTNKRVDLIIAGSDNEGKDHAIIVELKQWDRLTHTDMPDIVKVEYKYHEIEQVHPSWQAYTYESTICNFNENVEKKNISIHACAFLHNYKESYAKELMNNIYKEGIEKAYPYIRNQYNDLAEFVFKYVKKKSKNKILFEISEGRIKPSKILIDSMSKMLEGNEEFVLIDEQRVVFSNLLKNIESNLSSNKKQVYIVKGGMGTGKTVIAMQLLSRLLNDKGLKVFYVAKSGYVREAYERKLTRNLSNFKFLRTLFQGSGNFINSLNNEFDCLIVDEAHRLTEKTKRSYMYYGKNQIQEIIHASKNSVFFIDEKQQIDIKDYGSIENIVKCAKIENAEIHNDEKYTLYSQFRCNGSDEYVAWLEAFLYNSEYIPSGEKVDYDIRVFDDIIELKNAIVEKNKVKKSRVLSGDVFPWLSMKDKSKIDINIGEFHAQWNKNNFYSVDPLSIDEVGCIHTSQNMDFDYVGLIVGDDLIYRNGKVLTDYSKHPSGSGEYRRPHQKYVLEEDKEIIDKLIRNTYRVLFSRGQKGTYLYIMDDELREYVKKQINTLLEK